MRRLVQTGLAVAVASLMLGCAGFHGGHHRERMACDKCCCAPKHEHHMMKHMEGTINTAGVAALVRAKEPVVILDARTGKFDDGKRIPGAKSLNAGSTEAEIAAVLPDKNQLVVTYCVDPQCPASAKLAERLRGLGFKNVLEDHEGIVGWIRAGNAVEEKK